tara:strand:- start:227 stop:691 length:465 start_codon:yes stop_codon:yes gene_type:complete
MKPLWGILLLLILAVSAKAQNLLEPPVTRMNILYGKSNCHDWHTMLWISLPNRGLTVWGELYNNALYNPSVGWVMIGQGKMNLPILMYTGQICTLLVTPSIFFIVPMNQGYAKFKIFDIPKNFPAIGLHLYAQGGFETHLGVEGFSRGVEFVIQ